MKSKVRYIDVLKPKTAETLVATRPLQIEQADGRRARFWRYFSTSLSMVALLALVLLAKVPSVNACSCVMGLSENDRINRADLVFVGKLVEIRQAHNWFSELTDLFSEGNSQGTEIVFEVIQTIKGHPTQRQAVVDATHYGSDCDHGPPDLTSAIGKTLRVIAYRHPSKEIPPNPEQAYAVFFTFCDYSFKAAEYAALSGVDSGFRADYS